MRCLEQVRPKNSLFRIKAQADRRMRQTNLQCHAEVREALSEVLLSEVLLKGRNAERYREVDVPAVQRPKFLLSQHTQTIIKLLIKAQCSKAKTGTSKSRDDALCYVLGGGVSCGCAVVEEAALHHRARRKAETEMQKVGLAARCVHFISALRNSRAFPRHRNVKPTTREGLSYNRHGLPPLRQRNLAPAARLASRATVPRYLLYPLYLAHYPLPLRLQHRAHQRPRVRARPPPLQVQVVRARYMSVRCAGEIAADQVDSTSRVSAGACRVECV